VATPLEEFLAAQSGEEMEKDAAGAASWGQALGGHLLQAGATLAVAGLGSAGYQGYKGIRERYQKPRDYKAMLQENPSLRKESPRRVQMLYNSFRKLSPTMASDPLLAGSFVRDTLAMSPDAGTAVSPMTAKTVADTQKSISASRKSSDFVKWMTNPGVKAPYGY
jgi:hypothetical protein